MESSGPLHGITLKLDQLTMPSGVSSTFTFKRSPVQQPFVPETSAYSVPSRHYLQSSASFGAFYVTGPAVQQNVPSAVYIAPATSRTPGYNSKMATMLVCVHDDSTIATRHSSHHAVLPHLRPHMYSQVNTEQ